MENTSWGTYIGLIIIVLHLIAGFGFMIYMLTPKKSDREKSDNEGDNNSIA